MATRIDTGGRLLVKLAGDAGELIPAPFAVETYRALFPAEDLTDASLDGLRAAWSGAELGAFDYVSATFGGITSRFGRFPTAGRVYLGSQNRPAQVVPGDTYRTGLSGYRTAGSNDLRAGVRWRLADGTTRDELLVNILGSTPVNTWQSLAGSTTVPADARGASPWVESPGGWHIDVGAGATELSSRVDVEGGKVTIRRGRSSGGDGAPGPATCSTRLNATTGLPVVAGDQVRVELPDFNGGTTVRFRGWVDDPELEVGRRNLHTLDLVGTSALARLSSVVIGDTPWPAESAQLRADRILDLATAGDPWISFAPRSLVSGPTLRARDVDAQPAIDLLDELLQSAGGLLREYREGGVDYATPRTLWGGVDTPDLQLYGGHYGAPLKFRQGSSTNSVRVLYGDPDANPRPAVELDDAQAVVDRGRQHRTITTELASQADAEQLARDVIARGARPAWRLDDVEVDLLDLRRRELDGDTVAGFALQTLLLLEVGWRVELLDLPASAPQLPSGGLFMVEGWTETITPASWRMQLQLVDFAAAGGEQSWGYLPADLTWADLPVDLTWAGMAAAHLR